MSLPRPASSGAAVLRVAVTQAEWTGDRASMLDRHEQLAREAHAGGAQVVCFQELFHAPADHVAHGESGVTAYGHLVQRFAAVARELGVVLVLPIHEQEMPGIEYDTAVVVDADGSVLGCYRRQHVLAAGPDSEGGTFRPGNVGFPVFHTTLGSIGVCLGDDRHFPEAWRALGLGGAHLVVNPCSARQGPASRLWDIEHPAAAAANGFYVAVPNQVGLVPGVDGDRGARFHGTSQFCDPWGRWVGDRGAPDADEIVMRDLDLGAVDRARDEWPLYGARRPDAYGVICQR